MIASLRASRRWPAVRPTIVAEVYCKLLLDKLPVLIAVLNVLITEHPHLLQRGHPAVGLASEHEKVEITRAGHSLAAAPALLDTALMDAGSHLIEKGDRGVDLGCLWLNLLRSFGEK